MSVTLQLSLHVAEDENAMALEAARLIAAKSKEAIAERGEFSLALSGGATPLPLFRLLGSPAWSKALDWSKFVLFWVDERCVAPESEQSNYGLARQELFSKVEATRYYRMRGEEVPEKAAKAYERLLVDHFTLKPGELPRFDCVLLGIGQDGHTGSLFAGDPALREKKALVMDVYNPSHPPARLTLTLPVINNARCCMFLASGKAKRPILNKALNLMQAPELPAQMVRPGNGELCWIIDRSAYEG